MSKPEEGLSTLGRTANTEQTGLEKRLEQHQQALAEQERANQIKAQDLLRRERQFEDDKQALQAELKLLQRTQARNKKASQRRNQLILPILLISAIAAGVFAFDNLAKQERYAAQVNKASDNIDKLTKLLHGKVQGLNQGDSYQQLQDKLGQAQSQIVQLEQTLRLKQVELAQQSQRLKAREQALASLSGNSLERQDILAPISASNDKAPELSGIESPILEESTAALGEATLAQQSPSAEEGLKKTLEPSPTTAPTASAPRPADNTANSVLPTNDSETQSASFEEKQEQ